MLGTIGSFIAYPIVGNLLSDQIKKSANWALKNSGKLLSNIKASGRASLSVIKSGQKIKSYQDLRTTYLKHHEGNLKSISRQVNRSTERFKSTIKKGYERRIDTISRKFGGKTNFGRKIVKDAIKGEVKFLPMTYVMYKAEQMQGNIPADQGFMGYYATSGLPMSLGFSAGFDIAKRSMKVAKLAAFSSKASMLGLESIAKVGAEGLHNLNKMTKGMFAVYDNAVSKFVSANQTFKAFGSTTAALKAIGRASHQVNSNKAKRSDISIMDSKVRDNEFKDKSALYDSYAELMGDTRSSVSRGRDRLLQGDIGTGEGGELQRSGFNKKFTDVHRGLRKLSGGKYYGDDVAYTGSKVVRKVPRSRSEQLALETTDTPMQFTQDRTKIDFLGGKYDLGVFHIDSIRDSMDKVATQFLNIANRPWLNFLDAGNHWLQSSKTKMLTQGIQKGTGVVGLQGQTIDIYTYARPDDRLIEEYNKGGSKVSAATRAIQIMTKAEQSTAESYLKAKQDQAVEYARLSGRWNKFGAQKDDIDAVKEFVAEKIAFGVATRGEWTLSNGDVLDIVGKHAKVHTKLADGNRATFTLHSGDVPIHATKLLRGDTRAGQIAGGLLGGKTSITGPGGMEIESGIESTTNISMQKYYRDASNTTSNKFITKLGDLLEWNGGSEQSLFGRAKSVFTKYKDPAYIGKVAGDIKRGSLDRENIEDILKKGGPDALDMVKGISSYSRKMMNGVFASMRATDMAEGSVDPSKSMTSMYAKVMQAVHSSGKLNQQDSSLFDSFDVTKAVVNETDSTIDILNKLKYTNNFFSHHESYLKDVHGFDESPIRQLQELILSSKDKARASALGGSLSGNGDRVDRYNREIFDFLISVSSKDRYTRESAARAISEISSYGAGKISAAKLNLGETNINGIAAAMHMSTVGNSYSAGASVDSMTRSELSSSIESLAGTFLGSGRNNLRETVSTFGGKKRVKEAPGAANKFVLLPDNVAKETGLTKGNIILNGTNIDVRFAPISRGQVEQLAAVGTMNSALSMLGLGFDLQSTFTVPDIITKTLTKRVLPIGMLFGAHDIATSIIQQTPILKDTSLAGGVTGMLWDGYAGARVLSQAVTDFTGITSFAQKMEELVPGSIDSPLSGLTRGLLPIAMGLKIGNMGRMGAMKGGMIGAGIGMVLGGGPLGLFDDSWNLAKGREQVIAELSGEKEVAVSKGRFWELSGSAFWGDKISYFRPSLYALQKKQYQRADNYIGNDLTDMVQSYIDPGVYAQKHYISRPYEMVGGKLSNIPLIGTSLDSLVGGTRYMHQDFLQEMSQSSLLSRGTVPGLQYSGSLQSPTPISSGRGAFYGGGIVGGSSTSSLPVMSPTSFGAAADTTIDNMLDVAGLRGFMLGNVIDAASDQGSSGFSGGFRTESANDIASFSKSYWEKELGGIIGLSEGIRRIFPNPSPGDTERINRIANAMPLWLPGKDSFIDYLTGDPYSKVQMGEVRLPGKCILPDSLVMTSEGMVPAEDIQVGQQVLTSKGIYPITNVFTRNVNENVRKISVYGGPSLSLTEEHEVLTIKTTKCKYHKTGPLNRRPCKPFINKSFCNKLKCIDSMDYMYQWVPAKSVEEGDYVVMPKADLPNFATRSYIDLKEILSNYDWIVNVKNNEWRFLRSHKNKTIFHQKQLILPDRIFLTDDLMYIFGFYCAEGHISSAGVHFTCSLAEKQILEFIVVTLKKIFGEVFTFNIVSKEKWNENAFVLNIYSKVIKSVFEEVVGSTGSKKLPLCYSNIIPFLSGLFEGDGHVVKEQVALTASLKYKYTKELPLLFSVLNIPYTIIEKEEENVWIIKVDGNLFLNYPFKVKSCPTVQTLSKTKTHIVLEDRILLKVRKNEIKEYRGMVYDYEVRGPHNFVTSFVIHNSYESMHNVYYTYPIDSMVMGKSYEEQVSFYAGDVTYLASLRRNWHVVERTRKELIGELKKTMPIVKEADVAYDTNNDVHSYIDAVMQDDKGIKTAIAVTPMIDNYADPGGSAQLNAYLVNNTKEIRQGLLIAMDKDGNISKQIVYADAKKYLNDLKMAQSAARQASKITQDLQEEGYSVNRWPAYSHLNRLQILINVAPFSKEAQLEMKIVKQQVNAGMFGNKEMETYKNIMDQFVQRLNSQKTQEYKFLPLLMGKTPMGTQAVKLREEAEQYSRPEQLIGAAGEYITHLRNPVLNKLMGKKSMYEQYREDVALGKGFTKWQNPVEDYIAANMSLIAAEEDPLQAAMSGATGGFIFGGPIGAGLGAGAAGVASLFGLTSNTRASRMQELDDVQVLADALKYKEATDLEEEYAAEDRRFTLRRKGSAYYNYTEGANLGEVSGFNDVTGSLSSAERSYVRRMMQSMHKEDIEKIAPLLPTHAQGMFISYATGQAPDTSGYQKYMTDSRRIVEGAPLQFRSDDMVYKTLQSRGLDAHGLGLGWAQQVNRVKYMENSRGMDIPTLNQDPGYPGVIPSLGAVARL